MICSRIIGDNSRGAGGENSIKARVEPPTSLGKKKGANQEIGNLASQNTLMRLSSFTNGPPSSQKIFDKGRVRKIKMEI